MAGRGRMMLTGVPAWASAARTSWSMTGTGASSSIGETARCSVRCGLRWREDADAGRGERCRGRCTGLQAEPFEVSVQHQCRDGRVGSQADAGERPGRQHLRDLRGKAGACRGIGRWRAKQDVFGPVEDVHGALDARGGRIGQESWPPYCLVLCGAASESDQPSSRAASAAAGSAATWLAGPVWRSCPAMIRARSSPMLSASSRSWVTWTAGISRSASSSCSKARMSSRVGWSSADSGSSSSSRPGLIARARARATRWRSPPLSERGDRSARCEMPSRLSSVPASAPGAGGWPGARRRCSAGRTGAGRGQRPGRPGRSAAVPAAGR